MTTTSNKELLELAAKAAGYLETASVQDGYGFIALRVMDETGDWTGKDWNPLTDDGDALRLAVKLNITVGPERPDVIGKSLCRVSWLERTRSLGEYGDGCPRAATRRAIVRAAAEIGKTL